MAGRSYTDRLDYPDEGHPRFWALGTLEGAEVTRKADALFEHGKKWLIPDDIAVEATAEIVTSPATPTGHTRSLHALYTDDRQRFHIHLPHTEPGSVKDASELKGPASHRLVFAMTGAKPGLFEWAEATGPISVEANQEGICLAKGAVKGDGYRVKIPPYTMVAIELNGGIHHFHNVKALSYHRLNNPAQGAGDNLTLNTQQWHGDLPKHFKALAPEKVYRNMPDGYSRVPVISSELGFDVFMQRAHEALAESANQAPDPEKDNIRKMITNMHILALDCSDGSRSHADAFSARQELGKTPMLFG